MMTGPPTTPGNGAGRPAARAGRVHVGRRLGQFLLLVIDRLANRHFLHALQQHPRLDRQAQGDPHFAVGGRTERVGLGQRRMRTAVEASVGRASALPSTREMASARRRRRGRAGRRAADEDRRLEHGGGAGGAAGGSPAAGPAGRRARRRRSARGRRGRLRRRSCSAAGP